MILIDELKVNNCILIGKDIVIDKTRDEGATELLTQLAVSKVLLVPDTVVLIGSRSEELVDKIGAKGTLFDKIDYCVSHLPLWWRSLLNPVRTFKHFAVPDINSSIDGEATSIHFGAGKRTTFTIVDEIGQVEENIASKIVFNLSDVGRCNIYNSTHFYGTGHTFAKLLKRKDIQKVKLLWYLNPEKSEGLYESPKIGYIQIKDKDYYIKKCHNICNEFNLDKPIEYNILQEFLKRNELENVVTFVADGGEKQPIICRSVWHDREERKREWEDLCKNVWAYPAGAADTFFDSVVNDKIRLHFVKLPKFQGEITYDFKLDKVTGLKTKKVIKPEFKRNFGKNPLKWWGELLEDKDKKIRPNQFHNYIIGCDISFGMGASNSTAMILDVDTGELIGEYVTAGLYPQDFGILVSALALWIGGASKVPYIIWERNGGHGQIFGETIISQGFVFVYTDTIEDAKTRVRKRRYGWTSTGGVNGTKNLVLGNLKNALREGLKAEKTNKYIIIYSESLVDELDSYMWFPSGDVATGEQLDLSTGARARHGDRIIGTALACLALKEQGKAVQTVDKSPPFNSFAWRSAQRKQLEAESKLDWQEPKRKLKKGW